MSPFLKSCGSIWTRSAILVCLLLDLCIANGREAYKDEHGYGRMKFNDWKSLL